MTKSELIDFLRIRLGERVKREYGYIEIAINLAMNELVGATLQRKNNPEPAIISNYVKDIVLEIKKDSADRYYCEPPFGLLITNEMPYGIYGIMRQSPPYDVEFVPNSPAQEMILSESQGSMVDNTVGYYLMDNKIMFESNENTSLILSDLKELRCMLVKNFTEIGPDDEVYVPFSKYDWLVEKIVMLLQGTPPEKKLNDQSQLTT